ncbi:MAG: 50S ribosomal protein L22 [Patescibacteria group bacterium]|nr:50S ribosomal protein L22 [Patescibacteria group bacterium]
MEIEAKGKSLRISPRKLRLIADSLRGLMAEKAINKLTLIKKRGALIIMKTLKSAIANAVSNSKLKKENLYIKSIEVLEGASLKRFHPSTRGRAHPYKKRSSHLKIILEEKGGEMRGEK